MTILLDASILLDMKTTTINLGNNESVSCGVFEGPNGFLALTFTQSKTFKTRKGAEAWLARKGVK